MQFRVSGCGATGSFEPGDDRFQSNPSDRAGLPGHQNGGGLAVICTTREQSRSH